LDDPSGKEDAAFLETIRLIEEKVRNLRHRMMNGMETVDFSTHKS
jgi:hypothetical protein